MKTCKALWFGTVALLGLAANANAQIVNSAHNFSSMSWSGGEICLPCHTPHGGNAEAGALWNHALTNATYQMFEGAAGTAADDFDHRSRLCLSCHDGTVALDSFGGQTGTNFIGPNGNLGTDLTNDHPVGSAAVYPETTSTRFNAIATLPSAIRLRDWTDSAGVLHKVVGCSTCHNVHNKGFPHLLTMSNSASAVCLSCHIK